MGELEWFISLQYARGLYGKNHPLHFLYNEAYVTRYSNIFRNNVTW